MTGQYILGLKRLKALKSQTDKARKGLNEREGRRLWYVVVMFCYACREDRMYVWEILVWREKFVIPNAPSLVPSAVPNTPLAYTNALALLMEMLSDTTHSKERKTDRKKEEEKVRCYQRTRTRPYLPTTHKRTNTQTSHRPENITINHHPSQPPDPRYRSSTPNPQSPQSRPSLT